MHSPLINKEPSHSIARSSTDRKLASQRALTASKPLVQRSPMSLPNTLPLLKSKQGARTLSRREIDRFRSERLIRIKKDQREAVYRRHTDGANNVYFLASEGAEEVPVLAYITDYGTRKEIRATSRARRDLDPEQLSKIDLKSILARSGSPVPGAEWLISEFDASGKELKVIRTGKGRKRPGTRTPGKGTYGYQKWEDKKTGKLIERIHRGNDYSMAVGTPVQAVHPGTVVYTNEHYSNELSKRAEEAQKSRVFYGGSVVVYHGILRSKGRDKGVYTLAAHASRVLVRPGDEVLEGTVILLSGNSGYSDGGHLHYAVLKGPPSPPFVILEETILGWTRESENPETFNWNKVGSCSDCAEHGFSW